MGVFMTADVDSQINLRVNQLVSYFIQRRGWVYLMLIGLGISYILAYMNINGHFPADDAYIHMRIARNFAQNGVPYYNIDQAVAGSSSMLWLILISFLFYLFGASPSIVWYTSTIATILVFLFCAYTLSYIYSRIISIIFSFSLIVFHLISVSASLMETPLVILFWILSFMFIQKKQYFWVGIFAGLSFATRYEFIVWVGLIFLLIKSRRDWMYQVLGVFLPFLMVILFNMYFFQSLIPNTVRAKSIIYTLSMSESIDSALFLPSSWIVIVIMVFGILLSIYVLIKTEIKSSAIGLMFGFSVLCLYVLRRSLIFPWYVPIFLFTIAMSCFCMYRYMKPIIKLCLLILITSMSLISLVTGLYEVQSVIKGDSQFYAYYMMGMRVKRYLQIGAELADKYPHKSLMTSEIGGLGWTFPGKIIDAAGLVSPECLSYHPLLVPSQRAHGILGSIPPQAVIDLQPDLVISIDLFSEALRKNIMQGTINNYHLLALYPAITSSEPQDVEAARALGLTWTRVLIRDDVQEQRAEPSD